MKKYIKIAIVVILSLMILFEIGYIVKTNVMDEPIQPPAPQEEINEPSELPVVGATPQPEETQ